MQLWGVTEDELAEIVKMVSDDHYEGNLILNTVNRVNSRMISFTLRVTDSKGPGHRLGFVRTTRGNQVRMVSACWHAHRDVMRKIFEFNPDARIKSHMADYRGANDFETLFGYTGHKNAGSMMEPTDYADLCECEHTKVRL